MTSDLLQEGQFFRERAARAENYEHRHHNGDADEEPDDETREVAAHKHVFGR